MIIRAKAPLRLGLAGGGTDIASFSNRFGGAILNATINLYARASIIPRTDGQIELIAKDLGESQKLKSSSHLKIDGHLSLLKGVYNRIVKDYKLQPLSFTLLTDVDVPKGSGLGSSSTLTVAIIAAFAEWLNIPLGEYELAELAYNIERIDLLMDGGKQDQYAASFGGINYMEFLQDGKVIVNPLRVREAYLRELEYNLVLFYTGRSRLSSSIIKNQASNFNANQGKSMEIEAGKKLKSQANQMKISLLTGKLNEIGDILNQGWKYKKQTAVEVTNPEIDKLYQLAMNAGASGGKISGAGGGGFMFFFTPGIERYNLIELLEKEGYINTPFAFEDEGVHSWIMQ